MKTVFIFLMLFISKGVLSEDYIPQNSETLKNVIKNANSGGCPISSEEKLACGVVLCNPVGLVIAESRGECLKINSKWAIYLATLGPFDSPARCRSRDMNCQTGSVIKETNQRFCGRSFTGDDYEFCINNAINTKCEGLMGERLQSCKSAVRHGRAYYLYREIPYYIGN